jgi:asparagine synthase (glutamine-hydrolysing)
MVSYRDETYFEGLKILPERCNLKFKGKAVSVTPYWDIDPSRKFRGCFQEKRDRFLELFRDAIKLHLRSDVEVGGCLSGGLDSASIASVVAKDHQDVPFKTFTIYYQGKHTMDERRWADEVLTAYPKIESVAYCPSDDEIAASFDSAMMLHDVPIPMSTPLSYYCLMQLVSEHKMKVVLDGQGSDEYLGGYSPSFDRLIDWASLGREDFYLQVDSIANGGSRLKQYFYNLMFLNPLPSLLHYSDRMSMGFSIETRVPFLDHRLVELVHSFEDEDIIYAGITKYILRRSLKNYLPKPIATRMRKQPFFGSEACAWLRGPLRHLIERNFDFDRVPILDPVKVKELLATFGSGDNSHTGLVWKLATLNDWSQRQ